MSVHESTDESGRVRSASHGGAETRRKPRRLSASLRFRAGSLALLLLAAGGACNTWRVQQGPAPQVVAQRGEGRLRIVLKDQSVVELVGARVVGDSIVGIGGSPPRHLAGATADVQRIDAQRVDPVRTGALTVGVVVAAIAVAAIAVYALVFGDPDY